MDSRSSCSVAIILGNWCFCLSNLTKCTVFFKPSRSWQLTERADKALLPSLGHLSLQPTVTSKCRMAFCRSSPCIPGTPNQRYHIEVLQRVWNCQTYQLWFVPWTSGTLALGCSVVFSLQQFFLNILNIENTQYIAMLIWVVFHLTYPWFRSHWDLKEKASIKTHACCPFCNYHSDLTVATYKQYLILLERQ